MVEYLGADIEKHWEEARRCIQLSMMQQMRRENSWPISPKPRLIPYFFMSSFFYTFFLLRLLPLTPSSSLLLYIYRPCLSRRAG
jgi:hypothetical protein